MAGVVLEDTMTNCRIILVGGGARSGKSDFALDLARDLGPRRLFLATAQAGDAEMAERIRRHRLSRGDDFVTIEEPLALAEVVDRHHGYDVLVVDCLTLWLANMLLAEKNTEDCLDRVEALLGVLRSGSMHAVLITNEVGLGIVPEAALGRLFRDVAGLAHQRISRGADEVYFAVLGTMLRLKPAPALVEVGRTNS